LQPILFRRAIAEDWRIGNENVWSAERRNALIQAPLQIESIQKTLRWSIGKWIDFIAWWEGMTMKTLLDRVESVHA
jgi:hypothetical protein